MKPVIAEVIEEFYTPELLRSMPEKIFVFGDNLLQRGTKGQAAIRNEPNAFGVPTKRAPSMAEHAFFADREDENSALREALRKLYALGQVRPIVFPAAGIGTGLAQMASRSPELYRWMCGVLRDHFSFDQSSLR
ncbi:TPA: hypothetical protein ACKP9S_002830 [Pseudomonas aeruginosa]